MTDMLKHRIKAHRSAPDVYDPPTFEDMANRIEELEAAYNDITLDIDNDGIWLIDNTDQGVFQMGHVSWRQVAIHVQKELERLKGDSDD